MTVVVVLLVVGSLVMLVTSDLLSRHLARDVDPITDEEVLMPALPSKPLTTAEELIALRQQHEVTLHLLDVATRTIRDVQQIAEATVSAAPSLDIPAASLHDKLRAVTLIARAGLRHLS